MYIDSNAVFENGIFLQGAVFVFFRLSIACKGCIRFNYIILQNCIDNIMLPAYPRKGIYIIQLPRLKKSVLVSI